MELIEDGRIANLGKIFEHISYQTIVLPLGPPVFPRVYIVILLCQNNLEAIDSQVYSR